LLTFFECTLHCTVEIIANAKRTKQYSKKATPTSSKDKAPESATINKFHKVNKLVKLNPIIEITLFVFVFTFTRLKILIKRKNKKNAKQINPPSSVMDEAELEELEYGV
jgi:hypothetical protein